VYWCNSTDSPHEHVTITEIQQCWQDNNGWPAGQQIWVVPLKQTSSNYIVPAPAPVSAAASGDKLAKFTGHCALCNTSIPIGFPIRKDGNGRWVHKACPSGPLTTVPGPTSPSVPAPTIAPYVDSAPASYGQPSLKSMFEGPFIELLEKVPDGYFAVREEEGSPITFLRVSRPTYGTKKNCLKIQTQHAEALDEKWIRWPDGRIYVYSRTIEEVMLILITSYKEAARLYGKELGKCARCNTELTDARSRWLSIGPECEKYWPWFVDERMAEAAEAGEEIPGYV
jgi:hypothetical protein